MKNFIDFSRKDTCAKAIRRGLKDLREPFQDEKIEAQVTINPDDENMDNSHCPASYWSHCDQ